MSKSKIEWLRSADGKPGYTINPVKGLCPVDCKDNQGKSYCYARKMHKRFRWNPEIRWEPESFIDIETIRKPSRIFIGSTIELFGEWVKPAWLNTTFRQVESHPQHTFIFLTKQPEELLRWSPFPFNCYIGLSATNQEMHNRAIACLSGIKASVKFISYEPLLKKIDFTGVYDLSEIQWVIVGQQTPTSVKTSPKIAWIQDILVAASNAGNIPVFLKNNLSPLLVGQWAGWKLRQEFPE